MRRVNWGQVQEAQDRPRATPGGYIAIITGVQDFEDKEYLLIEWDFAEGPLSGSNRECFMRNNFWPMLFIRSYKESALSFFKAFKTALEESNPGYYFDEDNLNAIVGKRVGLVLGEEEYKAKTGEVKTSVKVQQTRSVEAIRKGDFDVPALKKLKNAPVPAASDFGYPIYDDNHIPLPFD